MEFDIFDDMWAEYIFWYMEDKFDSYCEYLADMPNDISLAEYVYRFHKSDFKQYLEGFGFEFC